MRTLINILLIILISVTVRAQNNTTIIESNNRFAFDVYAKLKKTGDNLILSPASITSAMAMTYMGARANTLKEISSTFYFAKDKNQLGKSYNAHFYDYNESKENNVKLFNANSLWIQDGLKLNQDFLSVNKNYFGSLLQQVDFIKKTEESRITINSWVEKNTNNRIKNLIKPSAIDNTTRLVLVNAIFFKAPWEKAFKKEQNTTDRFQTGKSGFISTTFMNKTMNLRYYSDKCAQIVDIPYSGGDYSLMIILPKSFKAFKKIEEVLDFGYYQNFISNKELKRVNLSMPKFSIESEFDLNKTLAELGMKEAFTESANFSGITEQERLFISTVAHKANITIDEEGTEAAAATAVMMTKTSIMIDTVDFKVDKPFFFILRNNKNNLIYFMGKISNPG